MKKSIFSVLAISVSSFFQLTAHAGFQGSYLFCVNEKNTNNWAWAPGSYSGVKGYDEASSGSSNRGIWLNGKVQWNSGRMDILRLSHTFKNENDAKNFCTELKNICTNEFGPNYTKVGVSSWEILASRWGQIQVKYKHVNAINSNDESYDLEPNESDNTTSTKDLICPNWEITQFPNS